MFRNIFSHSNDRPNHSVVAVPKPKTEKKFVVFKGLSDIEHEGVVLRTITYEKAKSEINRFVCIVSVYKKGGIILSKPYLKWINKSYCEPAKVVKGNILDKIPPQYFDYDWMINEETKRFKRVCAKTSLQEEDDGEIWY